MSHWMQGKIEDLHCSIDKMIEAIVNIMPEWEGFIDVSNNGELDAYNSYTRESKKGFHIRVSQNSSIGLRYCDFAMRHKKDGTWQIEYDAMGLPIKMNNPQNSIKDEIAAMGMEERVSIENLNMIENTRGKVRKQVIRMSPEEAMKFLEN